MSGAVGQQRPAFEVLPLAVRRTDRPAGVSVPHEALGPALGHPDAVRRIRAPGGAEQPALVVLETIVCVPVACVVRAQPATVNDPSLYSSAESGTSIAWPSPANENAWPEPAGAKPRRRSRCRGVCPSSRSRHPRPATAPPRRGRSARALARTAPPRVPAATPRLSAGVEWQRPPDSSLWRPHRRAQGFRRRRRRSAE